jgi:hypothetical protein
MSFSHYRGRHFQLMKRLVLQRLSSCPLCMVILRVSSGDCEVFLSTTEVLLRTETLPIEVIRSSLSLVTAWNLLSKTGLQQYPYLLLSPFSFIHMLCSYFPTPASSSSKKLPFLSPYDNLSIALSPSALLSLYPIRSPIFTFPVVENAVENAVREDEECLTLKLA